MSSAGKILSPCSSNSSKDGSVGLSDLNPAVFISSRYRNLPLVLVAEGILSLTGDVAWSLETEEMPPEEKPFYKFTHVLAVTL